MELRLEINPNVLTLDDLIALEDSGTNVRALKTILSRFVVNGSGAPVPREDAEKMVGSLNISQVREATEKFTTAVKELQATAVPPPMPAS